jgi:pyruvate ferredoxin oxidoreductase alpha subunit
MYKMLNGNYAAVEAMKMARVGLVAAYPITPQSAISENLAVLTESGELDSDYVRVESEHTAMSVCIGAQLTGIRTATATSSVGLALMHEMLCVASGLRLPIVMPVVNRTLAAPWSLWCDHQDTMAERDSGWIQLYCEDVQEVFDLTLAAYKIGEHSEVLLPVMVCLDGFYLSHSTRRVTIPKQEDVDAFIGPYVNTNMWLDPEDPLCIDNLTGSHDNTEIRYQQTLGFERSKDVIADVFSEFTAKFGRFKGLIEAHRTEDADAIIICMGSMAGTAKYTVNRLREQGQKVGMIKVVSFRPFPFRLLREAIGNTKRVAVVDRTASYGGQGTPLWVETKAALRGDKIINGYIAGLAGRDISYRTMEKVFADVLAAKEESEEPNWIDCDTENAMKMREVLKYV